MANKKRYIVVTVFAWLTLLVPIIVYNALNYDVFTQVNGMKLTTSGLILAGFLGFAALTKLKNKSGAFTILAAVLMLVLQELFVQIAWNLLIIGINLVLQQIVFKPLQILFKERWYNETGRTVTYTRTIS